MSVQFDHLVHLMYGTYKSKAMFAACELGIFEALSLSEKSTAESLAKKLSTNQVATVQLLDTLVSLELLEKDCDEKPPCYSNTETTEKFLVKSSPESIRDYIFHLNKASKLFDNLTWAIREGENQWQRTFGHSTSALNPFNSFYATKEERINFLNCMRVSSKQDALKCVRAFDLREFNRMCDLGGCTGDIAYAACMAYPDMKITVLDLPSVVELAPHFRPSIEECSNQANVCFMAGDFFNEELPPADLYLLTRILHDWDEDKMNLLLTKIFKSLPPGGGLVIGEILLRDDKTGPLIGNLRSLMMLTLCSRGAGERSAQEYIAMLNARGFEQVQTKVTQGFFLDAILARKPKAE